MKIILDRNLVFMQFQNLLILTISCFLIWLGLINSTTSNEFLFFKITLFILILFFTILLFTKKGLLVSNGKIYTGIFLFQALILKKLVDIKFDKITLLTGNLSTNYNYSLDIDEFHNWEPNLNHSISIFTICQINENHNTRTKIISVTNIEKAKKAIDFLTQNSSFEYEKYNPK